MGVPDDVEGPDGTPQVAGNDGRDLHGEVDDALQDGLAAPHGHPGVLEVPLPCDAGLTLAVIAHARRLEDRRVTSRCEPLTGSGKGGVGRGGAAL